MTIACLVNPVGATAICTMFGAVSNFFPCPRFFSEFCGIPSDCTSVSLDDRLVEVNGIRWTDFDDEDHANTLLDDRNVKIMQLGIVPFAEESDASFDTDDVSISDEEEGEFGMENGEEYSQMGGSVINQSPPSLQTRPKAQRKLVDVSEHSDTHSIQEGDELDDDASDYTDNEEYSPHQLADVQYTNSEEESFSDNEPEQPDQHNGRAHKYKNGTRNSGPSKTSIHNDNGHGNQNTNQNTSMGGRNVHGNEQLKSPYRSAQPNIARKMSNDDDKNLERSGEVDDNMDERGLRRSYPSSRSQYEEDARRAAAERMAQKEQQQLQAQEEAIRAKQLERDRARALKLKRMEQKKEEEAERNRKAELARKRRETLANGGMKATRSSVKVERNIGAYSIDGTKPRKSTPSSPGSGWSMVSPTKPKPSTTGWNKVAGNPVNTMKKK